MKLEARTGTLRSNTMILKSAGKRAIRTSVRALTRVLPKGAQQAILDGAIAELDRFETFQRIAASLRVETVSVRGSNGLVWGSIADYWVLGMYASQGRWASQTVSLFNQLFSSSVTGGAFFDIGANIGLTLFPVAQNPLVQCYGFEPEPRNFAYLTLGSKDCPHRNVFLQQLALFDKKGTLEFELSGGNFGDHRIRTAAAEGFFDEGSRTTIPVGCNRLDDVAGIDQLQLPLGVKIDAQGSEPNIFVGGERTLALANLLSFEFAPYLMRRIGGDVDAELQILAANFREGSIAPGETENLLHWHPIDQIVDELAAHWRDRGIGTAYFDVLVRK